SELVESAVRLAGRRHHHRRRRKPRMNSLTYISRQLEHSISHERLPQLDSRGPGSSHLRRSETWSKPFHFRRRGKKPFIVMRDSSEDSSEDNSDSRPINALSQTHIRQKRSFSSP